MTVRPATAADLAAVSVIQAASPHASHWDPASYLDYACTVAEEGGNVIGFLVSRDTGQSEHEILNLAVHPSKRRHGVARQLLRGVITGGSGTWFLEVRASNFAAIYLYESMGFHQAGRREGYYSNPSEPAIVMKFVS